MINRTRLVASTIIFTSSQLKRQARCIAATTFVCVWAGAVFADAALCKQTWLNHDYQAALIHCSLAAKDGNADAQETLGFMYQFGEGVVQDYARAASYYALAARQGKLVSQVNLGALYQTGRGVAQSDLTAFMWYTVASRSGWPVAVEHRGKLGGRLTDWQISDTEARARRCISSNYTMC